MRFGLAIPHYDTSLSGRPVTWEGVRDVARLAERSGFDSVWVSDHLFLDWGKYGGPDARQGALECWTTMSAVAAATSGVRVGSLAVCNDFRNPALLAKMAATLDVLSDGRLELGIGAGWYEPEFIAAGLPFERARTRIERLGEAVEVVGRLLEGEELTYDGRYYSTRGAICRPLPVQEPRPRIWIGGKGDRLLATAARVADGWNFSWLGSIELYRARLDVFERACKDQGRDPETVARSVGVYLVAGRDEADARRRFDRLSEVTPPGVLQSQYGDRGVSWERFRERNMAGAVDEVTERLGRLAELGVEEVIVSIGALPFQVADAEDVELIGNEIAPALR